MNTTLEAIARTLQGEGLLAQAPDLLGKGATPITGADCDSRHVEPGHLFVCKGAAFRASYLEAAVAAGAVAYLCDQSHAADLAAHAPGVPALVATDAGLRHAMALASLEAWGHPDRKLAVVGMTGTKGKSTSTYMLRAILDAGHQAPQAALMGSIDTFDGVESFESVNTTPEAPDLWRHVANAAKAHLPYLAMEVSSQALKYDRVVGLGLDVACFLNIGRDHISPTEHPTFEDYFASKLRIFDQAKVAVVNLDMDMANEVLAAAGRCERLVTFSAGPGARTSGADLWAAEEEPCPQGVRFLCHTPSWEGPVVVGMPGLFNVENALCAIACCEVLGVGRDQVVAGLAHARVPGRMEPLPTGDPKLSGLVDYAHNKLSYQRFFSSVVREYPGRAIVVVMGAPGGKALERRKELPEEASKWADYLIYTEEDPANDPLDQICAQMAANTPEGQAFEVVLDRPAAVARAVEVARACPQGAVVCLLAKGDETRQHVGNAFVPCETDATLFYRAVGEADPRG